MKHMRRDEYQPIRSLIGQADDYHIYHMTVKDKAIGFSVGFTGGAVVSYLFFRSIFFALICGVIGGVFAQKPFADKQKRKRLDKLRQQFKDMLESLSSSYMAGKNTMDSFQDCYKDLQQIYGIQADIINELRIITMGMQSNLNIEVLLKNFALRSGLDDVQSFADVFEISLRQGANIQEIIVSTRTILNDKMEMEMEIDTLLSGNRNELNTMMLMPLVIIVSLGGLGSDVSITSNTPGNIALKLFVLFLFGLAYKIGSKIMDIKV